MSVDAAAALLHHSAHVISVQGLIKTYGTAIAVDRLSFTVAAGEIVGLIGPNGAGKTSTLRCIAGIHRPSGGRVTVGDHDIVQSPTRPE